MVVGLLGLQGAFLDHRPHLERLGASPRIVRDSVGLQAVDRLIIPGGESTVMAKFLEEYGMVAPLRARLKAGMPVWGICAGTILLADRIDGAPGPLGALPIAVSRNAYGRQIDSQRQEIAIALFGTLAYPAIFIRAPRIDRLDPRVKIHATLGKDPVFVQSGPCMATTFHPELNRDGLFHRYFLSL
ncbi:MAG: pyridoxal 5'-phosphate synthase glutaminase subunit PdxT [Desulfosarcinaceae bacterium]|jgi:5'-phosphate synthase pdxT subunit